MLLKRDFLVALSIFVFYGIALNQVLETPKNGGKLAYAELTSKYTIDPIYGFSEKHSRRLIDIIYDGLLTWNAKMRLQPALARELPQPELRDDGTVRYRVYLKDNVFWHQGGVPLTAGDVAFTIKALQDPVTSSKAPVSDFVSSIIKVEVVDPKCVDIYFINQNPQNRPSLTFKILPKHIFEAKFSDYSSPRPTAIDTFNYLSEKGCGTGSFKINTFCQGFTLMDKNTNDYIKVPYLDMIQMKKEPNPQNLIGQAILGTYNFIPSVPISQKIKLANSPDWEIISYYTTSFYYIGLNCAREPFNNVKFRQALAKAIDKEKICHSVFLDAYFPLEGPHTPAHGGLYSTRKPHRYNPNLAKDILNSLGYIDNDGDGILEKDNKKLTLSIIYEINNREQGQIAQIVIQNLSEIGIEVSSDPQQEATINDKVWLKHDFDMVVSQWKTLPYDGDLYDIFHSSQRAPGLLNYVGYANPGVDQLLTDARSYSDYQLISNNYRDAAEIIMIEVPYIFVCYGEEYVGKHKSVRLPENDINWIDMFINIRDWWIDDE